MVVKAGKNKAQKRKNTEVTAVSPKQIKLDPKPVEKVIKPTNEKLSKKQKKKNKNAQKKPLEKQVEPKVELNESVLEKSLSDNGSEQDSEEEVEAPKPQVVKPNKKKNAAKEKNDKKDTTKPDEEKGSDDNDDATDKNEPKHEKNLGNIPLTSEMIEKYPILANKQLKAKIANVKMTANQKGRIRLALRDSLKSASEEILPDVIDNRIKVLLKKKDLSEPDLRRLRILNNMLIAALTKPEAPKKPNKKKNKSKNKKEKVETEEKDEDISDEEKEEITEEKKDAEGDKKQKVKGDKRYVVFIGNLPTDITKEQITSHFSDLSNFVKDVRIPQVKPGKKSAIAYLELKDESSYELALSKNHTMLSNRRINVLYSKQQNSKVTDAEAKGKTAKLQALQKAGKLLGSVPLNRKRSQRRKKLREARAREGNGDA